jgi:hypothetical protein
MQFKDILVLLQSHDGTAIGALELGNPATKSTFNKVEADIRLMMPSSQYSYNSNVNSHQSEESSYISSSVAHAETRRNTFFFKRS